MVVMTTGRVLVEARIENLDDLYQVEKGLMTRDQVRKVEVPDALVDTGASLLSMPRRLVEKLGLRRHRARTARTPAGVISFGVYNAVRLTVQGRDCVVEVADVPDDCPVLIGQLPLEGLDYMIDPVRHVLVGNPEHGGEQMMDMFAVDLRERGIDRKLAADLRSRLSTFGEDWQRPEMDVYDAY
jgi:predicted aspartyl protease